MQRLRHLGLGALFALWLTGCGGSGGTPTPIPEDGSGAPDGAVVLAVGPPTVDANFNTPVVVDGTGFVGPVEVEFVDADGRTLGAARAGRVEAAGRRIRTESPIVPGLMGRVPARVRVRGGDGRVAESAGTIELVCPVATARAINGAGNHETEPNRGSAGSLLRLELPSAYADGASAPAGSARPSARAVSQAVCAQAAATENARGVSDMFWLWGQFLDHDIDLTPGAEPVEALPIAIPVGDPWFDPAGTGLFTLAFERSAYHPATGTSPDSPRRQINEITSWIDASNVYGSDAARATALRTLDGTGRLRLDAEGFLPRNTAGLPNAPSAQIASFFLAGDVRANEQLGLTAMHTLWVREHNRLAAELQARNPHLSGDEVYETARSWVAAEMQVITVREFLPLLLGEDALGPYAGYDDAVDASVGVLFSTACYRFGHSMVSGTLLRLDAAGLEIADGHLALRDAFFQPERLVTEGGLDPVLRGFAAQRAQELDPKIVDDLRNFLFGPPGAGGFDLAALNLQRGRDHGLPDYNACRAGFGLPPVRSAAEISADPAYVAGLEAVYADVDDMDVWIGAICEDREGDAMVGPLLRRVLGDQVRRLRDGDRYWYARVYSGAALEELERTRLADVIRRNTGIGGELADRVLEVPRAGGPGRTGGAPRPSPLTQSQIQALSGGALVR